MKTTWVCEFCSKNYKGKDDAEECESDHCESAYAHCGTWATDLAKKIILIFPVDPDLSKTILRLQRVAKILVEEK